MLNIGDHFRFGNYKTVWEVLQIVERGIIIGQYLPGSSFHHGHQHLAEWIILNDITIL